MPASSFEKSQLIKVRTKEKTKGKKDRNATIPIAGSRKSIFSKRSFTAQGRARRDWTTRRCCLAAVASPAAMCALPSQISHALCLIIAAAALRHPQGLAVVLLLLVATEAIA